MAIHSTEIDARAARLKRAGGRCECPGIGCNAPTHQREITPDYRVLTERGCTAQTATSGPGADMTRVVLFNPALDPLDDANLRVLCMPCAENHERAMAN